jgi:hypothetical protein
MDLVALFVHRKAIKRCPEDSPGAEVCFIVIFAFYTPNHPYAAISATRPIFPIPAIAFPMDDGPDVLSDGAVGHGSAARTICFCRRAGA